MLTSYVVVAIIIAIVDIYKVETICFEYNTSTEFLICSQRKTFCRLWNL
jgi:hypothetical protein